MLTKHNNLLASSRKAIMGCSGRERECGKNRLSSYQYCLPSIPHTGHRCGTQWGPPGLRWDVPHWAALFMHSTHYTIVNGFSWQQGTIIIHTVSVLICISQGRIIGWHNHQPLGASHAVTWCYSSRYILFIWCQKQVWHILQSVRSVRLLYNQSVHGRSLQSELLEAFLKG